MKTDVLAEPSASRGPQARASQEPFVLQRPPRDIVHAAQWEVYADVMQHARRAGARFAVGGGLATSFYTGAWRPTKDIDLYVLPNSSEALIEATRRAGLQDYYDQQPYDRSWIYRGVRDGTIVDVIWALANGYGRVEQQWLDSRVTASVRRLRFALLAPEEILVTKLHVLQRDRCDWPDLLNLLYTSGPQMDWGRLLASFRDEERLVAALVQLFAWLAPARAAQFPARVWDRLRLAPPDPAGPVRDQERIDRLDTRPWFTTVPAA